MNKFKKIKVLAWCDSPTVATGFATVSRGILNYLASTGKYDIDVIGINEHGGWHDPDKWPYHIYPARLANSDHMSDYYGRPRLIASLLRKDPDILPPWDIIWTLNDTFILEEALPVFNKGALRVINEIRKTIKDKLSPEWQYKIISYFPVDSTLRDNWVSETIALADYPVLYTEYGKQEVIEADTLSQNPSGVADKLRVISHGFNNQEFFYIKDRKEVAEFRQKFFNGKVGEKTFLVSAVARNQVRKDLPRTMKIFKEFQRRRPKSFLYLHCQETDVWGSLREYARNFDLEYGKDWGVPAGFSANTGLPVSALNFVYNASDAIISTSLGEGLGFYNLESFATKTPVLAPHNTSHPELFNVGIDEDISSMDALVDKARGIPLMAGSNSSEWAVYGPGDHEMVRPLVNVDDAVKKLLWVYDNRDKAAIIATRAHQWVQNITWDKIGKQWDDLFQEAYAQLTKEREEMSKDGKVVKKI
jgi:glycosyltransferase involved in cell wall biosynthesis